MRAARLLTVLVAVGLLAAGCGGGGSDESSQPAQPQTPDSIRTAVYERSFSECSTYSVARLAGKYGVDRNKRAVTIAVGHGWSKFFKAGPDAARAGREGCTQALQSK